MKTLVITVLGLIVGFLVGMVVAQLVGITGLVLFGGVPALSFVRFLPFVLAGVGAAVGFGLVRVNA